MVNPLFQEQHRIQKCLYEQFHRDGKRRCEETRKDDIPTVQDIGQIIEQLKMYIHDDCTSDEIKKQFDKEQNPKNHFFQTTMYSVMLTIIQSGRLDIVKLCIEKHGFDLFYSSVPYGKVSSPGFAAYAARHLHILQYFDTKGVDLLANDCIALCWASCKGQLDVLEYLIARGANVGISDHYPIRHCFAPYNCCRSSDHLYETWEQIQERYCFETKVKIANCLYQHGADVRANFNEGLRNAVSDECLKSVKWFVEHGAKVNTCSLLDDRPGHPLRLAVRRGLLDMVQYLVEEANAILVPDLLREAVHYTPRYRYVGGEESIQKTRLELVRFLATHYKSQKNTALTFVHEEKDLAIRAACTFGDLALVSFLVEECGANIHVKHNRPLRNAIVKQHWHVVEYLLLRCGVHPKVVYSLVKHRPVFRNFLLRREYSIVLHTCTVLESLLQLGKEKGEEEGDEKEEKKKKQIVTFESAFVYLVLYKIVGPATLVLLTKEC
jgi:hypothetical protein